MPKISCKLRVIFHKMARISSAWVSTNVDNPLKRGIVFYLLEFIQDLEIYFRAK